MTDPARAADIAVKLTKDAIEETRGEIVSWAGGPKNNGPFSDEAYRTYIHIQAAFEILANKLTAHIERLPHD